MKPFILRWWMEGLLILGILLGVILFLTMPVSAADNQTMINITVNATITPTPTPTRIAIYEITKPAEVVYYGEVVNLLGSLAADDAGNYRVDYWFEGHSIYRTEPDATYDVIRPKACEITQRAFPYEGTYYQHQSIREKDPIPVMQIRMGIRKENMSEEAWQEYNQTEPVVIAPYPPLPDWRVKADYLQARYDYLNFTYTGAEYLWLAHNNLTGGVWWEQMPNNGTIPTDDMLPGEYTIILQKRGNRPECNLIYNPDRLKLEYLCGDIKPATWDLSALDATATKIDDIIVQGVMEVQEPFIEIKNFDQIDNDTYTKYFVQGYTNIAPGQIMTLVLDREERDLEKGHYTNYTKDIWYATTQGNWSAYYRTFSARIAINPMDLKQGNHYLSVISPYNSEEKISFYVYEIPGGTPPPETHIKYIGNSPFIPTPTPEVQVKTVERVVEKVITVQQVITPSTDSCVNFSRDIVTAQDEKTWENVGTVAKLIALGLVGIGFMYLIYKGVQTWKKEQN